MRKTGLENSSRTDKSRMMYKGPSHRVSENVCTCVSQNCCAKNGQNPFSIYARITNVSFSITVNMFSFLDSV